jgi:ABC-type transporter Mla subunit MlaD
MRGLNIKCSGKRLGVIATLVLTLIGTFAFNLSPLLSSAIEVTETAVEQCKTVLARADFSGEGLSDSLCDQLASVLEDIDPEFAVQYMREIATQLASSLGNRLLQAVQTGNAETAEDDFKQDLREIVAGIREDVCNYASAKAVDAVRADNPLVEGRFDHNGDEHTQAYWTAYDAFDTSTLEGLNDIETLEALVATAQDALDSAKNLLTQAETALSNFDTNKSNAETAATDAQIDRDNKYNAWQAAESAIASDPIYVAAQNASIAAYGQLSTLGVTLEHAQAAAGRNCTATKSFATQWADTSQACNDLRSDLGITSTISILTWLAQHPNDIQTLYNAVQTISDADTSMNQVRTQLLGSTYTDYLDSETALVSANNALLQYSDVARGLLETAVAVAESPISALETALATAKQNVEEAKAGNMTVAEAARESAGSSAEALAEAAAQAAGSAACAASNSVFDQAINAVQPSIESIVEKIFEGIQSIIDTVKDAAAEVREAVQKAIEEARATINDIRDEFRDIYQQIREAIEQGREDLADLLGQLEDLQNHIRNAIDQLQNIVDKISDAASDIANQVREAIAQLNDWVNDIEQAIQDIKDGAANAVDKLSQLIKDIVDNWQDISEALNDFVKQVTDYIVNGQMEEDLRAAIGNLISLAKDGKEKLDKFIANNCDSVKEALATIRYRVDNDSRDLVVSVGGRDYSLQSFIDKYLNKGLDFADKYVANICIDDDEDGVYEHNDDDLCPNTPVGEPVDSDGCSESQKDDDGDNVTNDKDECPDVKGLLPNGCNPSSENGGEQPGYNDGGQAGDNSNITTTSPISQNSSNRLLATNSDSDETTDGEEISETELLDEESTNDVVSTDTVDTDSDGEVLGAEDNKSWSVANLILAAGTVLMSVIVLLGYLGKSEGEKKHGGLRTSTLIPAAAAVATFFWTEDWRLPMSLFDVWTILMLAILAVSIVLTVLAVRSGEEKD